MDFGAFIIEYFFIFPVFGNPNVSFLVDNYNTTWNKCPGQYFSGVASKIMRNRKSKLIDDRVRTVQVVGC